MKYVSAELSWNALSQGRYIHGQHSVGTVSTLRLL
jgi:hypothetical protein